MEQLFKQMQRTLSPVSSRELQENSSLECRFAMRNDAQNPFIYFKETSVNEIETLYIQLLMYWKENCQEKISTDKGTAAWEYTLNDL